MKKMVTLLVASSALFGAQTVSAQTYSPPGTYVYQGSVSVQKDLGVYNCVLTVTVNVPSTPPTPQVVTATAALTPGDAICSAIAVNGTGTVSYTDRPAPLSNRVTITGLQIVPAISIGRCTGSITADWGGNGTPSLILSSPLSNSAPTAGAPCKMIGTLNQISGPAGGLVILPDT